MSITHNEYEMIKKMIGDFLQQRREEVGLTQAGVAESAGIRESTVQRIESGKFIPGGKTLLRLCEALSLQLIFQASSKPNLKKEMRSEEHTSELQSRGHLVCRLLLEKKKKN